MIPNQVGYSAAAHTDQTGNGRDNQDTASPDQVRPRPAPRFRLALQNHAASHQEEAADDRDGQRAPAPGQRKQACAKTRDKPQPDPPVRRRPGSRRQGCKHPPEEQPSSHPRSSYPIGHRFRSLPGDPQADRVGVDPRPSVSGRTARHQRWLPTVVIRRRVGTVPSWHFSRELVSGLRKEGLVWNLTEELHSGQQR